MPLRHRMISPPRPLYLAGPTGSGKTAIALALSHLCSNVEIVNADAFQAYRGMEILSAAPTAEERRVCPHHLFSCLDPSEENDAATFARLARAAITDVSSRALPVVVGGSGLYLKAITHGLAPTPKGDPQLRAELEREPLETLIARYRSVDPEGAAKTDLRNRRYVTRNLEISILTGQPASQLKAKWARESPDLQAVYLVRDRGDLHDRISLRTDSLFDLGVIEEVGSLPSLSLTASKAIGVPEIRRYLSGEIDEKTCREALVLATRQYVRRQDSWFRREPGFFPLPVARGEESQETASRIARHFSLLP